MRISASIFVSAILLVSIIPFGASADEACATAGTVPITDRDLARLSGIPDTIPCWDPKDPTTGSEAAQAKQYLLSIANPLRNSKAPPDAAHIAPLNAAFAKCAAKFLQAYKENYGPVVVVSAFRCGPLSPAAITCNRSENAAARGATNSNHQTGTALDINLAGGNSSYETLKSFAQANPEYGVNFPWPIYENKVDKPHMQAANLKTPSCAGVQGTPVTPGPGGLGTTPGQIAQGLPGLMQGLQNFFSPPQPQQCQAGMILLNGTCVPQQSQQTSNPFNYINPPTPSPTPTSGAAGTTGSAGSSGSTGSGADIGSGISISGLLDSSGDKKKGTSTSAIDLINAIANPTTTASGSATGTAIGKSVALNDALGDKATLGGTLASSSATLGGSSTYALMPVGSQTFVSQDLSKTPMQPFGLANNSTFALLENIRRILIGILQALRPFGGAIPHSE
jgi:hypothetical protein